MASFYQDKSIMPRPGGLLLVNSILFTAASLFAGGFGMAAFLDWRFLAGAGIILFGVPGLTLGCLQYSAIFGGNAYSAAVLAVFLIAAAALVIQFDMEAKATYLAHAGLGFVALWLVLTAVGAIHWCRQLLAAKRIPPAGTDEVPPSVARVVARLRPYPLAIARLGWARPLTALLIILAGAALGYHQIPPKEARHVSPAAAHLDLPAGATDVCVIRSAKSGGPALLDFAVDEANFLKWVKTPPERMEMQLVEQSVTISRYAEDQPVSEDHVIHHGWYHMRRSHADGVEYVDFAYDADNGRAYFCADSD